MRALEVFQDRVNFNLDLISKKKSKENILLMIKANGYGHGESEVFYLAFEYGVRNFGVASLEEALHLRKTFQTEEYLDTEIYVFSDFDLERDFEQFINHKIIPVISNKNDFDFLIGNQEMRYLPLVLKFDTGMNRLGLKIDSVAEIISKLNGREIYHLMTHFSDSYLPKKKKTNEQYSEFLKIKNMFMDSKVSIVKTSVANSGAIENDIGLDETMIRPGLMFYGPTSTMGKNGFLWGGKILSNLSATILKTQWIGEGEKIEIGYGSTLIQEQGLLITVSIGYGDGLFNLVRGHEFEINGYAAKVVARVNMDMIFLHISAKKPEKSLDYAFRVGEVIDFWDEDPVKFQKLCETTGLIPYEVFCSVSKRVKRIIRKI